jgi:hypothetical protein
MPETPFYSNEGENKTTGNGLCISEYNWVGYTGSRRGGQCVSGHATLYDAYPHSQSLYLQPNVHAEAQGEDLWGWEWW